MKLRPVTRNANIRYPSFASFLKRRPAALRHLAIGAGLLAAGSVSVFAGENGAEQPAPEPAALVPFEVQIMGRMVMPQQPTEQVPAETAEAKPAEPLTAEQTEQLEALVVQLGDNNFQTREAAQRKIEAMGAGAAGPLEKYKEHDDAEVRMRVAAILAKFAPPPADDDGTVRVRPGGVRVMPIPMVIPHEGRLREERGIDPDDAKREVQPVRPQEKR